MKSSLPPFWEHFKSQHNEIESRVDEKTGGYKNLPHEALYSSFEDLESLFFHPLVKGTFLDLGCGTGQAVLLYAHFFPNRKAIGIEFQDERIKFGKQFHFSNAKLIAGDLLHCEIPYADTYFLYFPTGPVLDRILTVISNMSHEFVVVAIESHGHLYQRLDLENWLKLKAEVMLKTKRHSGVARIYQNVFQSRSSALYPFLHTYRLHYLLIENGDEEWIGETFGMEWQENDRFELLTPPRTILWKDVKKLMLIEDVPTLYQEALRIRRLGEISLTTKEGRSFLGYIRKIIVKPTFIVELSSGEKVEWNSIQTIFQGNILCYEPSS